MTKCAFCKKEVVPPPTEPLIGSPDDPEILALLRKVGRRCHECGKVSCQPCAYKAAREKGNRHFTCPHCGANIHDNPLEASKPERTSWLERLFGPQEPAEEQPKEKSESHKQPLPVRREKKVRIPDDGRPTLVLFLVDREPPWGRDTHVSQALQAFHPGLPSSRAVLQVNRDCQNPIVLGTIATMVARQHGFEADLQRLEYKTYQSADGVSGTVTSIYRK
ncbi:MAG: hypothetical protein JXB35_17720 [Anaerolineae bacterium]|nr:hypothetical protein [Anaerolineae bacterium]